MRTPKKGTILNNGTMKSHWPRQSTQNSPAVGPKTPGEGRSRRSNLQDDKFLNQIPMCSQLLAELLIQLDWFTRNFTFGFLKRKIHWVSCRICLKSSQNGPLQMAKTSWCNYHLISGSFQARGKPLSNLHIFGEGILTMTFKLHPSIFGGKPP